MDDKTLFDRLTEDEKDIVKAEYAAAYAYYHRNAVHDYQMGAKAEATINIYEKLFCKENLQNNNEYLIIAMS